jgi:hypothetical protein
MRKRNILRRTFLISVTAASLAFALEGAHYIRWNEIQPLLDSIRASAQKPIELTDAKHWDGWIRLRDFEIRAGIDRGIEDSISMLIMTGTSFTSQPPLASATDAVTEGGALTPATRARMEAFINGLDQINDERFRAVLQFLRRREIAQDELRAYLSGNLRRAALEWAQHPRAHTAGTAASDIEQILRGLTSAGKAPTRIRRIGVIGPGLDPQYDPASYNPFIGLEAAIGSGLAKAGNAEVVVFDINPWVLSAIHNLAAKAARNAARVRAADLNIVTQTLETPPGQGFDLVVGGTALAGYGAVDQALAMLSVSEMMSSGGIFLVSGQPSATIPSSLEILSATTGTGITAYRRR